MSDQAAWLALAATLLAPVVLACSARLAPLRWCIRPLAGIALAGALYTAANGAARLSGWDPRMVYAQLLGAGRESNADLLTLMIIPIWPYGATALGIALALIYGWIVWRPTGWIAFMHPTGLSPDRIAQERARVARFDE